MGEAGFARVALILSHTEPLALLLSLVEARHSSERCHALPDVAHPVRLVTFIPRAVSVLTSPFPFEFLFALRIYLPSLSLNSRMALLTTAYIVIQITIHAPTPSTARMNKPMSSKGDPACLCYNYTLLYGARN